VYVHPLTYVSRKAAVRADKSTDDLLKTVRDSVAPLFAGASDYGFGVSCLLGVCILRPLSPHAGLEITLGYAGHFYYLPDMSAGTLKAVEPAQNGSGMSVFSHRFALGFSLMRGRKPAEEEDTVPDAPPNALPATDAPEEQTP
jgi:hypothetical protein